MSLLILFADVFFTVSLASGKTFAADGIIKVNY